MWVFINPWKITFEWYRLLRGHADEPEDPPFTYPEGLSVWPALLLFFLFAWAENVYTGAFRPFTLSVLVLLYSIVMWVGMAAFGKHVWLRNGEAFTVLFGFFSRFSPTELRVTNREVCGDFSSECQQESECVDCYDCYEYAAPEDRQLNLRPFAVGLALQEQRVSRDRRVRRPRAGHRQLRRLPGHRDLGEHAHQHAVVRDVGRGRHGCPRPGTRAVRASCTWRSRGGSRRCRARSPA